MKPTLMLMISLLAVVALTPLSMCQSASDRDPRSASKRAPLVLRFERLALAPSELVGVAEMALARPVPSIRCRRVACIWHSGCPSPLPSLVAIDIAGPAPSSGRAVAAASHRSSALDEVAAQL